MARTKVIMTMMIERISSETGIQESMEGTNKDVARTLLRVDMTIANSVGLHSIIKKRAIGIVQIYPAKIAENVGVKKTAILWTKKKIFADVRGFLSKLKIIHEDIS